MLLWLNSSDASDLAAQLQVAAEYNMEQKKLHVRGGVEVEPVARKGKMQRLRVVE